MVLVVVRRVGCFGGRSGGSWEVSLDVVGLVSVRDDGGCIWGSRWRWVRFFFGGGIDSVFDELFVERLRDRCMFVYFGLWRCYN